jgi:broad specificity phosphatase PhoE
VILLPSVYIWGGPAVDNEGQGWNVAPPRRAGYLPRMILLRHGQSEFNLHFSASRRDPGITDPKLTPLGHEQAAAAAEALAGEGLQRILVSPYTRALETAAPIARRLGIPVLVNPVVRERYAFVCDIGTPRAELARSWPEHDFARIDEIWWPPVEEPAEGILARAALFRAEMAALPDWSDTLVVSHWGFILSMTGQSVGNGQWLRCDPTAPPPAEIVWRHS